MLVMPGKSPQKQVMCQSGYLVPEAFKKEHEVLMKGLVCDIDSIVDKTIDYFELDYDDLDLEEEDTWHIVEYLSCIDRMADHFIQDLKEREY